VYAVLETQPLSVSEQVMLENQKGALLVTCRHNFPVKSRMTLEYLLIMEASACIHTDIIADRT